MAGLALAVLAKSARIEKRAHFHDHFGISAQHHVRTLGRELEPGAALELAAFERAGHTAHKDVLGVRLTADDRNPGESIVVGARALGKFVLVPELIDLADAVHEHDAAK